MPERRITRLEDPGAVADAAAERFAHAAEEAVARCGRFIVVLSGGSTPRALHERLARSPFRERLPWSKTLFLFGDERCVAADHEASNYRMAQETLFAPLGIAEAQVYRMDGEKSPVEAATRYLLQVRDLFAGEILARFDLLLLGLGADGHTASLFPGTTALEETRRWVAANYVPQKEAWRLTMTLPALGGARRVLFLVSGTEKSRAVAEAFGGAPHPTPHPAERVVAEDGEVEVLLDRAAAAQLP